ncbi:hypothetical protein ACJIZ3_020405 [Penstemon smallii]|uniref:Uncharacterized protein n=1 Tax=Penstemon smallii TaxID=265156 RepID=A0ABD3SII0_9LAMI
MNQKIMENFRQRNKHLNYSNKISLLSRHWRQTLCTMLVKFDIAGDIKLPTQGEFRNWAIDIIDPRHMVVEDCISKETASHEIGNKKLFLFEMVVVPVTMLEHGQNHTSLGIAIVRRTFITTHKGFLHRFQRFFSPLNSMEIEEGMELIDGSSWNA